VKLTEDERFALSFAAGYLRAKDFDAVGNLLLTLIEKDKQPEASYGQEEDKEYFNIRNPFQWGQFDARYGFKPDRKFDTIEHQREYEAGYLHMVPK
jgi:hypothetical protein